MHHPHSSPPRRSLSRPASVASRSRPAGLFLLFLFLLPVLALLAACDSPPPPPPPPAKVPVQTEVLERAGFRPSLRLLGRVEPAARFSVRPETDGEIRYPSRFADGLRTGERVDRGELLFSVTDPDRRLAVVEAELQAELAETELERTRKGVEGGFLPAGDLKTKEIDARLALRRLEDAEENMERLEERAPAAGVLRVDRVVPPGTRVTPQDRLAVIAADGGLRVEAWAASDDVERLGRAFAEGVVPAELVAPGEGELVGRGRLAELAQEMGDGGVARVVIAVTEDLDMPQVGDGVEAKMLLPERQGVLTVPERSLVIHGSVATVFVLEPLADGFRARSRQVVLGARHEGRVEIVDGLSSGETVAVEGAELLADGLPAVDADEGGRP